ncbi:unnamed protein product [Allacma fusca]|uniref:Uncharacterized protein n=1 Tax=Allacma fusca TaxID=39272 RepID=A0A8J2JDG7_9HEXA|nr:unnamed protein product [Allacma fusca]
MALLKLVILLSCISTVVISENATATSCKNCTAEKTTKKKSEISDDAVAIDADPMFSPSGEYGINPPSGTEHNGYDDLNTNPYVYGVIDDKGSYGRPHGNPLSYSAPSGSNGYGYNNSNPASSHTNDNATAPTGTSDDDIVIIDNPDISNTKPSNNSPSNSYGNPNPSEDSSYGRPNPGIDVPTFHNGYGYPNSPNGDKTEYGYPNDVYNSNNGY